MEDGHEGGVVGDASQERTEHDRGCACVEDQEDYGYEPEDGVDDPECAEGGGVGARILWGC